MTDEELVKRLRSYAKDQGGWHNIDDTCEEAADRIEALTKERNALRSALNRIRPIPERILRGIPVRDLAETLAEADSALIKGESHE
jgi:hypothetical protein